MKKAVILSSILLGSLSSFAKTYTCHFTEPFITVKYYETHGIMKINTFGEKTKLRGDVEMIKIDGGQHITIIDKQTATFVLDMKLTGQGSDGMSDRNYAYEAKYNLDAANTLIGGCEVSKGLSSKKLSMTEIQQDVSDDVAADDENDISDRSDASADK